MESRNILKPRFVDVQFDTSKLKARDPPDSEFDSDLDEDITSGNEIIVDRSKPAETFFVIDNRGDDSDMQIQVPTLDTELKTALSDVRPSLYISSDVSAIKEKMREINKHWAEDILLHRSILKDDSEKQKTVELKGGKKLQKRLRKAEREKTAGDDWYNMTKPELTDEMKKDLELLKMRKVLDTKTFYKKNDIQELPKYFEVGTVVDNATDFYSDRIPKRQRKQTLVDELLADEHFKKTNKKKYREALERQQYTSKKAYVQLKRMQKKEEAKQKKKKQLS
ncbi:deoxynucleotidyltransferase terminal-interacting protein 2 [Galendromus occidentalis]|uniref:Deoxynucleotidyltransferase terminal-interacting protein 2 n=1 Tax=Galendromus occidentalis TaxID=34638 RepID=A0AAJ6QQ66_9ACAR|nr:deoxynucleotidyltransferase terminal-interacting protein 2 [Galendromus occidentalis]